MRPAGRTCPAGGGEQSRHEADRGRPSLEPALGGWLALGGRLQAGPGLPLRAVPEDGLPGSPACPLETKVATTPPGQAEPSMWASACEVPLPGLCFPHFRGARCGATSSRKSSQRLSQHPLSCSPGCAVCVALWRTSILWPGQTLEVGPAVGQALRADPVREGVAMGGHSSGLRVQPHLRNPFGEGCAGRMATARSSLEGGSPLRLVPPGWQDPGACWNAVSVRSTCCGRPGPGPRPRPSLPPSYTQRCPEPGARGGRVPGGEQDGGHQDHRVHERRPKTDPGPAGGGGAAPLSIPVIDAPCLSLCPAATPGAATLRRPPAPCLPISPCPVAQGNFAAITWSPP